MIRGFSVASLLVAAVVSWGCNRQQQEAAHFQPADYFAKKRECYELVEKRDRLDGADWLFAAPQQCYVPSMNTCICEYVPKKGPAYVSDVLTGKVLASAVPLRSGESVESTSDRYQRERERLFSLCAK
jgi:hypothetical protein